LSAQDVVPAQTVLAVATATAGIKLPKNLINPLWRENVYHFLSFYFVSLYDKIALTST